MNAVDKVITLIFVLLLSFFLVLGIYSVWDSQQIYAAGQSYQYEAYKPTKKSTISFEDLQKVNSDVFGWLTVYGTKIDYPLVQSKNNDTYLNTNAEGKYSMAGSIFVDYRNSKDFTDFNTIIYGHHMEKSAMFGDLEKFFEEDFFNDNKYGNIFFNGKDHGIEFFAFMQVDAFSSIFSTPITGSNRESYLQSIYDNSMYSRDIDVSIDDHIVLLSTCTENETNGRHLLVGRITDKVYSEPTSKSEEKETFDFTNKFNFFSILLIGLFFAISVLFIFLKIYKKKRGERMKSND